MRLTALPQFSRNSGIQSERGEWRWCTAGRLRRNFRHRNRRPEFLAESSSSSRSAGFPRLATQEASCRRRRCPRSLDRLHWSEI